MFCFSDKVFHPECFVCALCGDAIEDEFLEDGDGQIVCTKDHSLGDHQAKLCDFCGEPLTDERRISDETTIVTVGEMTLHSDCFRYVPSNVY